MTRYILTIALCSIAGAAVSLAACAHNELLGPDGCKTNGEEQFDRLHFWRTPTAKCPSQGQCVPYSRWSTDYVAVMGGR